MGKLKPIEEEEILENPEYVRQALVRFFKHGRLPGAVLIEPTARYIVGFAFPRRKAFIEAKWPPEVLRAAREYLENTDG